MGGVSSPAGSTTQRTSSASSASAASASCFDSFEIRSSLTHINDHRLAEPCSARVVLRLSPTIMPLIESDMSSNAGRRSASLVCEREEAASNHSPSLKPCSIAMCRRYTASPRGGTALGLCRSRRLVIRCTEIRQPLRRPRPLSGAWQVSRISFLVKQTVRRRRQYKAVGEAKGDPHEASPATAPRDGSLRRPWCGRMP